MTTGYVSMRNEDGTQYAELVYGQLNWSEDFADRSVISKEVFDVIKAGVDDSRVRDCPDNGFFGIYQLKFHEVGVRDKKTIMVLVQNKKATAAQMEKLGKEMYKVDK